MLPSRSDLQSEPSTLSCDSFLSSSLGLQVSEVFVLLDAPRFRSAKIGRTQAGFRVAFQQAWQLDLADTPDSLSRSFTMSIGLCSHPEHLESYQLEHVRFRDIPPEERAARALRKAPNVVADTGEVARPMFNFFLPPCHHCFLGRLHLVYSCGMRVLC